MPKQSYIWNLRDPNKPEKTLEAPSPLCTMVFNHKISDIIAGGSYNGSISFFDQRKGHSSGVLKPVITTVLERSHHDPVYDIYWLSVGKSGSECVSTSTDGRLLWWDMKKIDEKAGPFDELVCEEKVTPDGAPKIMGGTSLEYNSEHTPLKYLVGTEQGVILQVNKRQKQIQIQQTFGIDNGKHHGPVYALQRNFQHPKYFLSVGDWSAKIWSEELKQPIMQTRYHNSYLTDGCWSPSRAGLFYLTRMDGFLDVWDFFYRQNEVAYSQKVSDAVLTSIQIGPLAAIGDSDGTVSMLSLCKSLVQGDPREKEIMQTVFEREFRREKNLEVAKRLADKTKPAKEKSNKDKIAAKLESRLKDIETEFYNIIADDEDQKEAIKARGAQQNNNENLGNTGMEGAPSQK